MTTEPARLALYNRLGEVLGSEYADTLMTSLPLQPASKLATRSDIAGLEQRIDDLAAEVRKVHSILREQQRSYTILTIGALTAQTAIFSLIVGLIT